MKKKYGVLPDYLPFPTGQRGHPLRRKFHRLHTHYYVLKGGVNKPIAVGEAREVKQLGPQKWRATVAYWDVNIVTNLIDCDVIREEKQNVVIQGPAFILVPKSRFRGIVQVRPLT